MRDVTRWLPFQINLLHCFQLSARRGSCAKLLHRNEARPARLTISPKPFEKLFGVNVLWVAATASARNGEQKDGGEHAGWSTGKVLAGCGPKVESYTLIHNWRDGHEAPYLTAVS